MSEIKINAMDIAFKNVITDGYAGCTKNGVEADYHIINEIDAVDLSDCANLADAIRLLDGIKWTACVKENKLNLIYFLDGYEVHWQFTIVASFSIQ